MDFKKIKRKDKGFVLLHYLASIGTFPTLSADFLLPVLSLSYVSSSSNVGTKPSAIHEIDSIISINLFART